MKSIRQAKRYFVFFSVFLLLTGVSFSQTLNVSETAPAEISYEEQGLPNFHKVSEDLYRGAQPEKEGFKTLKNMGIKTVVNFRVHHSDEKKMQGLGMKYVGIPINTWNLEDKHVKLFIEVMADEKNYPVFIHCQHGADRTGAMTTVYRMVFEGWGNEEALKEMTEGGYGFHSIWKNLPKYIKDFDIGKWKKTLEDIRKEQGEK